MSRLQINGSATGNPIGQWIPFGWFQIGYVDDFTPGTARPLEYLDRRLVAWRDMQNRLHLADAFCPHNGAHLGFGGVVSGDCLRCPFHGWEFGPDGRCERVPYSTRLPRAGLRVYPVKEFGQMCFAWFHSDATEPTWELPRLPELESPPNGPTPRYHRRVKMRWQDVGENACDISHFPLLHRTGEVRDFKIAMDGPYRQLSMTTPFSADGVAVNCFWTTEHYGPGLIVNRVDIAGVSVLNFTAISPIDRELVDYRMSWGPVPDKDSGRRDHLVYRMFIRRMMTNSDQDVVIFENKIYRDPPRIVLEDTAILDYRHWVAQFGGDAMPPNAEARS